MPETTTTPEKPKTEEPASRGPGVGPGSRLKRPLKRRTKMLLGLGALAVIAGGMLLYGRTSSDSGYIDVLPALLLTGIGAGLFFMPSVTLAMGGAGPRDAGVASGLANVALQLGAAFGVAVLASVSASRTNSALAAGSSPKEALMSGYHLGYLIAAVIVLTAAVVSAIVIRPRTRARVAAEPRASSARQEAPEPEAA